MDHFKNSIVDARHTAQHHIKSTECNSEALSKCRKRQCLLFILTAWALAGCGGGDGLTTKPQMLANASSFANYCGVQFDTSTTPDEGYSEFPALISTQTGKPYGAILSKNGSSTAKVPTDLKTTIRDNRGLTTGNYVGVGLESPLEVMGIMFMPILAGSSVGCVKSVSWLKPDLVAPLPLLGVQGQWNPSAPTSTLVWHSYNNPSLPVDLLLTYPLDGFEFAGNFMPSLALAYFSIAKRNAQDANAINVCQLPTGATSWSCSVPTIADSGTTWLFSFEATGPGTYMLTSTHSSRGL